MKRIEYVKGKLNQLKITKFYLCGAFGDSIIQLIMLVTPLPKIYLS